VALQHLGAVTLPAVAQRWCQGQRVPWNEAPTGSKTPHCELIAKAMPTAICAYALGIGYLVNSDAGQLLPQMVFEQMDRPLTAKLFSDDVVVGISNSHN